MTSSVAIIERLKARDIAEDYRQRGYEVELGCDLDIMPGYCADIVARKAGFSRVIEVKAASSLAANPEIVELARKIESEPGWEFEYVLVPEQERLVGTQSARTIDRDGLLHRVARAQQALDAGHVEAAFVLAWSAGEAALRLLIANEGIDDSRITRTEFVFDQATHLGLLSHDDNDRLRRMLHSANAIFHGFVDDEPLSDAVSDLTAFVENAIGALETGEFLPDHAVAAR